MSEITINFKSILGKLIAGYIEENRAVGYKYTKCASLLKQFDEIQSKVVDLKIVKEHILR